MDFNRIDDIITNYGDDATSNDNIQESLDQFDLEKLKAVYIRVTGRKPDLLKRHHLCQEIIKEYRDWIGEANAKSCPDNLNVVKIASLLQLTDSSSFRTVEFFIDDEILDFTLFGVQNRNQFYQKCQEELIFRSKTFAKIALEHNNLYRSNQSSKVLHLYFNNLYEGYSEEYCDYLLVCLVGLNLFKYQIIDIKFETDGIFYHNSKLRIKYDTKTPSLCLFHLQPFEPNKYVSTSETDESTIFLNAPDKDLSLIHI